MVRQRTHSAHRDIRGAAWDSAQLAIYTYVLWHSRGSGCSTDNGLARRVRWCKRIFCIHTRLHNSHPARVHSHSRKCHIVDNTHTRKRVSIEQRIFMLICGRTDALADDIVAPCGAFRVPWGLRSTRMRAWEMFIHGHVAALKFCWCAALQCCVL